MTIGKPSARFVFRMGWERDALKSDGVHELVVETTAALKYRATTDAPRRGHGPLSWNSIKKNIEAFVAKDSEGWYGNVVVDRDPKVRHTMLAETGTTRNGKGTSRRPESRKFLKGALLKMRVE